MIMVINNDINKLNDKDAFKVPAGYFDNLTQRVMERIDSEDVGRVDTDIHTTKTVGMWTRKSFWISLTSTAAACVAIVLTLNVFTTSQTTDNTNAIASAKTESASTLAEEDLLSYALYDGDDVYAYLSGETY